MQRGENIFLHQHTLESFFKLLLTTYTRIYHVLFYLYYFKILKYNVESSLDILELSVFPMCKMCSNDY